MNIQKNNSWSALKGALIVTVVIGHFFQLYLERGIDAVQILWGGMDRGLILSDL